MERPAQPHRGRLAHPPTRHRVPAALSTLAAVAIADEAIERARRQGKKTKPKAEPPDQEKDELPPGFENRPPDQILPPPYQPPEIITDPPPPGDEPPPIKGTVNHPGWNQTARFQMYPQPADDEAATARTIAVMWQVAREDALSETIRAAADAATEGARTAPAKIERIFAWVKRRVRYVPDEQHAEPLTEFAPATENEVIIRPVDLLRMSSPSGDCDDFATLTLALLLAAGVPGAFVTIAADTTSPNYSHVYAIAYDERGRGIPLDTSHGARPGWEARPRGKKKVWTYAMSRFKGLGVIAPWLQEIIKTGAQAGTEIAKARYGLPPAGTYTSGPQGTFYRQPEGAGALTFPGASLDFGGGGSLLLLLVAGVIVVAMIARK